MNDVDNKNFTPLHLAAQQNHADTTKYLLAKDADVAIKTDGGRTAYHSTAFYGYLNILQLLTSHDNRYINDTDNKGFTPLYLAVQQGKVDITRYLLSKKANVSTKTSLGRTLYHKAAYDGNLSILQLFVSHNGKHVNDVDNKNFTALHLAVQQNHADVVKCLLSKEANVAIKTDIGRSVYHSAAYYGYMSILQPLVTHCKMHVNDVDNKNFTPLHLAVQQNHSDVVKYLLVKEADLAVKTDISRSVYRSAAYSGYISILKLLLTHSKVHVNDVDNKNFTPLHLAVQQNHTDVVKYLLSKEADVAIKTDSGRSVYHNAAYNGYISILQLLVTHSKVHVNDLDNTHFTALHLAVQKNRTEVVKYLLAKEVDVAIKTDIGRSIYHSAAYKGYISILQLLVTHSKMHVNDVDNKNFTPLHLAVQQNHADIVKYLLLKEADVSIKTDGGRTVYHSTAFYTNLDVLQLITSHDNRYINDVDNKGFTPLYLAVQQGKTDFTRYLLSNNANASIKTSLGRTLCHKAAYDGKLSILQLLVCHNDVHVNAVDNKKFTALHLAVQQNHADVVKYLLSKEADAAIKTDIGRSVYHSAAYYGYTSIFQLLVTRSKIRVNDVDNKNFTALHLAVQQNHADTVKYLLSKGADVAIKTYNGRTVYHSAAYYGNLDVF